jgi:transposase InsO family protein
VLGARSALRQQLGPLRDAPLTLHLDAPQQQRLSSAGFLRSLETFKTEIRAADGVLMYEEDIIVPVGTSLPEDVIWPAETVSAWVSLSHADTVHGGYNAMMDKLKAWGRCMPHAAARIKEYIEGCLQCARYKPGKIHHHARTSVVAQKPLDKIQIDLATMKESDGYHYILVIHDIFTYFTDGIPLRDKAAATVADALLTWFSRFGYPKSIQSDQGREFCNAVILHLSSTLEIGYDLSAPHHPQSNARVERNIGTVKSKIATLAASTNKPWHTVLPLVISAINRIPRRSTGATPFFLLFGRECTSPFFSFLQECPSVTTDDEDEPDTDIDGIPAVVFMREWLVHSTRVSDTFREEVRARAQLHREKSNRAADQAHTLSSLSVGDAVMRAYESRSSKHQPYFLGPYIIRATDERDNYYLKTPRGLEITRAFTRNMLKLFAPLPSDFRMVPRAICGHTARGGRAGDTRTRYKVLFEGYGLDAAEYMYDAEIDNPQLVADYLEGDGTVDEDLLELDNAVLDQNLPPSAARARDPAPEEDHPDLEALVAALARQSEPAPPAAPRQERLHNPAAAAKAKARRARM